MKKSKDSLRQSAARLKLDGAKLYEIQVRIAI